MVTQARPEHNEEETQKLFSLFSKLLTGLISLSVTTSIGIAGFALRETYAAQLSIRELQTRMVAVEVEEDQHEQKITTNTTTKYKIQLVEQSITTMQSDIKDIKGDIRSLLNNKGAKP